VTLFEGPFTAERDGFVPLKNQLHSNAPRAAAILFLCASGANFHPLCAFVPFVVIRVLLFR